MPRVPVWLLWLGGLGSAGCADLAVTSPPLATIPQQPAYAEECHPDYPCYERMEDAPDWIKPKIYQIRPTVYWEGTTAVGSSMMVYYGNRAEESFVLTITGPSTATRTAEASSNQPILADYNNHVTPGFRLETPNRKTCGHLAQLTSQHTAITTIWLEWRGFGQLVTTRPGDDSDSQPDCECSGGGPGAEPYLSTAPNLTPSMTCSGDGGGGGPGDEGSSWRCYTVTIEHYLYYPDTGEVEFQYSEQYSYCEQVE